MKRILKFRTASVFALLVGVCLSSVLEGTPPVFPAATAPPHTEDGAIHSGALARLLAEAFPGARFPRHASPAAGEFLPILPSYARTLGNPHQVRVVFSAPVSPATAADINNYSITPRVVITQAVMDADSTTVLLTTAALADDTFHTLTVSNVRDLANPSNVVPANSSVPIIKAQGVLTRNVFTGIGGNGLQSLTNSAKFPGQPDSTDWPASAEAPANQGDFYGQQLVGYISPPVTGDYQFAIASDNQGQLWLSSDANPVNKMLLASVPDQTGNRQWNLYPSQRSGYVHLQAGRRYYIEALMAEATGNDWLSIGWRLRGMPWLVDGDLPIPGGFLSSTTPSAPVGFAHQPLDVTVNEGEAATFQALGSGTPPYTYQWLRNGQPIAGATAATYQTPPARVPMAGTLYSVVVSNSFGHAVSRAATLRVLPDLTPPRLVSISGNSALNQVRLAFSEPLDPLTAESPNSYDLGPQLTVLYAALQADRTNVVLTTSSQVSGQSYTLTILGVTDVAAAANRLDTDTRFDAWVKVRGFVEADLFPGIGGNAVTDLTSHPDFPDRYSSSVSLPAFERSAFSDNYGQRLSAWLTPPVTGFYQFYIASDDQSQLWLSTDENPAHASAIASASGAVGWRNYLAQANQRSAPVWMEAGRAYYLAALQKEGGGDDYVNVTWQLPGQAAPLAGAPPIPSSYLSSAANPAGVSLTVSSPSSIVVPEAATATFAVTATTSATQVFYQWQRNGVDIPGANLASYTTPRLLRTESSANYRCYVSVPGAFQISGAATVTVTPDTVAPQAISAATLAGSGVINICFNEFMDPASVANPANYRSSLGGQVLSAQLRPDGKSALLTVTALEYTPFMVTLNNLKDYAGNSLPANTRVNVSVPMENSDLGVAGDPVMAGSAVTCAPESYDVTAGGGDFWGAADRGHFVYQQVEDDFDVAVRVEVYEGSNTYSRAGLMARESLAAGSRMVNATLFPPTGNNAYEAHYRGMMDANVGPWPGAYRFGFPGLGVPVPNAWVRLARTGDVFTAFASQDGIAWTQFSQITLPLSKRLFLGMATSAQNNANGVLTRVSYRNFHGDMIPVSPNPLDLALKRAADPDSAYAGNNVYQSIPEGAQILDQPADPSLAASFLIRLQNDGVSPENAILSSKESESPGWTVTYRLGGVDITSAITSAEGFPLTAVPSGAGGVLQVDLIPGSRVLGAARKSATIQLFTDARTRQPRDSVRAEAINHVDYQPDLMVRRASDVLYTGASVFNRTGVGQTKNLRLSSCDVGNFAFRLVNAGNVTNTFVVTATAPGSDWGVLYYEGLTGAEDITAPITANGVYVTLSPGASWEAQAKILPGSLVGPGETKAVLVTARSSANLERADAVRMVATTPLATTTPQLGLYTTDADFEQGELIGTVYGGDQLTLSETTVTRPFIWVPNSNEGTVSKVDTRSGKEVARYRVCPANLQGNPSRTTIDQYGNCWVANRQTGTVVKIGLLEEGEFVDRNGNGVADTSSDTNDDTNITGDEIRPWGQDECVLFEVVLIPGKEGVFTPGAYAGGYANDYWNPGPRGMAIDYYGNLWCGTWGTMKYYYINGQNGQIQRTLDVSKPIEHHPYGAVIDSHGNLWSSGYNADMALNNVLFLNPETSYTTNLNLGHRTYGVGINHQDHVFIAGYDSSVLTRLDVVEIRKDWTRPAAYQSRGVAVTDDDDVWVANSGPGTVTRFSIEGAPKATIPVGSVPTGVAVDADGKVWVVNDGDEDIKRIDPKTDKVDLSKRIIGGLHYGYSDMTGVISRSTTSRFGTWTATHDALVELTQWGTVRWQASDPSGDGVRVRARSANLCGVWSAWESATNGVALTATPPGRYLQVEVALTSRVGEAAPIVYDLTVEPLPQRRTDVAVGLVAPAGPLVNDHLVSWTITATNHGPQDARGVIVSNTFPGVKLTSATPSTGTVLLGSGRVRCDIGELKVGSTFTMTVTGQLATVGAWLNTAAVSQYEQDPLPGNNVKSANIAVSANPCLTPPNGLVGWWPGDGDPGDAAGSDPGTLVNGVTYAPGMVGQAFSFNGQNAYVELGRVSPGTQWSLEAWVQLTAVGSGRRVVVGCHADCRDWSLLSNEGKWGLNIGRGGCVAIIDSGVTAVPGVWYHLLGTCDGTNGTIYVNGSRKNTEAVALNYVGSSASLRIGGSVCCGEYLSGLVDEPSLYNRALTDAEAFALYDSLRSGKCRSVLTPVLSIATATGNQVRLSWPTAAVGFHVESTPNLGGTWQPRSEMATVEDDQFVLLLPANQAAVYYRLKK